VLVAHAIAPQLALLPPKDSAARKFTFQLINATKLIVTELNDIARAKTQNGYQANIIKNTRVNDWLRARIYKVGKLN
jgi:hypothetical protein